MTVTRLDAGKLSLTLSCLLGDLGSNVVPPKLSCLLGDLDSDVVTSN